MKTSKISRKILGILLLAAAALLYYYQPWYTPSAVISIKEHAAEPLEVLHVRVEADRKAFPMMIGSEKILKAGDYEILAGGPLGELKIFATKNNKTISNIETVVLTAKNRFITGNAELDGFFNQVERWMLQDTSTCGSAKGYRSPDTNTIWLRDHTYQMNGFKYWEQDMKSNIDAFFAAQREDGQLPDFLCPYRVRVTVEADVEYLGVLAAYQVWQATGDDAWINDKLPKLDKALSYSMNSKDRWSKEHSLVKRGFTIDLWDFQWGFGSNTIKPETKFGMIVSDNSGFYLAALRLADLYDRAGNTNKQAYWKGIATSVKANANKYLWDEKNGYYTSFFHIDQPVPPVDSDESQKLTLGNTYTMNRADFASHEQIKRIIEAYRSRKGRGFKEWFSINPNYGNDKFKTGSQAEKPGGYVNGGIMPLVGGELARAAFANGYEEYGLEQLRYYISMTKKAGNKTYLWYWPDGRPGKDEQTIPTDGWGSSAMLAAYVEGLAGIVDTSKEFESITLSPRWPAANIHDAMVTLRYGASDGYVAYHEVISDQEITLTVTSGGSNVHSHIMLPKDHVAENVLVNNKAIDFKNISLEQSAYADFDFKSFGVTSVRIILKSARN